MVHSEGNFVTPDALTIYHQAWLPDGDPKAVVILLHGLAEHSGRYAHVAKALTDAGYAVHALDHRGHGQSDGKRTYVKSYAEYQRDILQFRRLVELQHPGLPLFVLGHSMGGNLALGHVLDHQAGVRGMALSAPALAPGTSLSPTKIKLAKLVGKIAPGLRPEALSADAISRDPAVVAAYVADPLVFNGKVTAGAAAALLGSMESFPARYAELQASRSCSSTAPPMRSSTSPARANSRPARSTPRSRPTTTTGCTTRSSTSRSRPRCSPTRSPGSTRCWRIRSARARRAAIPTTTSASSPSSSPSRHGA